MKMNFKGLVDLHTLPKTTPLLPLYEAIINSIQSIEDAQISNGKIEIIVERDKQMNLFNQWETDILLGFIPKYSSKKAKVTMTLKQNYMPWSINIGKGFSTEPLACGLYVNTVFGNQFWVNEPERYPKGYYGFSSKVRFHVFMGQRLTYDIDPQRRFMAKSVTFFYEISTCDLYVISAVNNSYLRPRDYLSLSFGLKFQWL